MVSNSPGVKEWLRDRMAEGNLSLRKTAEKTDLSHGTIADVLRGALPCPETVRKLARGFVAGNGGHEQLALEDALLVLAGHRTSRPEAEEMSPLLGQLCDLVADFSEAELHLMSEFAKLLAHRENR